MLSFFSLNKKTSSVIFITLSLLLISLPTIHSKPKPNSRILAPGDNPGCWLESYGRGFGTPITTCPDGTEQSGLLCYPKCKEGYTGVSFVCWENCPGGFTDTGVDCLKPGSYGRGAGYAVWDKDKCFDENKQGCEWWGAMWYPKCADNFHNVACCVCSPNCPGDMTDIGVSCQKNSYTRTAGVPLGCKSDQEEDAALCYTSCKSGYEGHGPVCWGHCPDGMYKCGALCLESESACVSEVLNIATEVLNGITAFAGAAADGEAIAVSDSGVDLGQELAQYRMCTNM